MTSSIPTSTKVLVVGGGPGAAITASVLAREGIDTVLLETDVFPRYHISESMLPSMRFFMGLIGADHKFREHGFCEKVGAAFLFNAHKKPGYTDFFGEGGEECYTWNLVRSEADDILFRHAAEQGAKVFDGVKVVSLAFESTTSQPVSAQWQTKDGASSGTIEFEYLVDASGRQGIMSTKYPRNRTYNQGLKNLATWGYWRECGVYEERTERNVPFFEALRDESEWAWFIPLHGGRTSIDVYLQQLKSVAPHITRLIKDGRLHSKVQTATDFSYSASSYAGSHYRIVGDAGAFINPFSSSGVHLALTNGFSAAATICASIRGHCDEATAANWHSEKVAISYTRILVVVMSACMQIRNQEAPILTDVEEDNFDKAFEFFKPVIQGIVDVKEGVSKDVITKTMQFCADAVDTERNGVSTA